MIYSPIWKIICKLVVMACCNRSLISATDLIMTVLRWFDSAHMLLLAVELFCDFYAVKAITENHFDAVFAWKHFLVLFCFLWTAFSKWCFINKFREEHVQIINVANSSSVITLIIQWTRERTPINNQAALPPLSLVFQHPSTTPTPHFQPVSSPA